jgi:hypothetical protein
MTSEALREGRIPLWDPSSFCGQPYLANYQAGVFYPINLLLLPFSPERSLGLSVWIHLVLAGVGGMLLLRMLGLSPGASLIGGLLFSTNGALAVRTGQVTMLATPAWIPLVLYLAARAVRGMSALPLALSFACFLLAGFPPIVLWGSLLAAAWTVHEWLAVRRSEGIRPLLRAGFGFLLGAGIAAVQLVPTAEFLLHSDRIRFTYGELLSSSWHPAALIRLLVPDWFGSPRVQDSWIELLKRGDGHYFQSYLSTAAYVGIGTLVFLALGAADAWRNRSARFLMIAGFAASLVLLGTPALRLVAALPGLAGSRVDRIVHLVVIALLVPSSFGIEKATRPFRRRVPLLAALFLVLLLGGLWGGTDALADRLVGEGRERAVLSVLDGRSFGWAFFFLGGAALLVLLPRRARASRFFLPLVGLLLVADTGIRARACHVTVGPEGLPRETIETRFLGEQAGDGRIVRFRDLVIPPGLPGIFGLEDVEGYNALTIKDYRAYYRTVSESAVKERRINPLRDETELDSPLLGALSARWILSKSVLPEDRFPLLHAGRIRIYENPRALPRAYLADRVVPGPLEPAEALALLAVRPAQERLAVVEDAIPPIPEGTTAEGAVGEWLRANGGGESSFAPDVPLDGSVLFGAREPERVVLDCAARAGGMLVLSDSYYPGWVARVDGAPAPIHRVNRIFRGVVVPAGVHRVEFRYEPLSFKLGALLSLLSLAGALLAARSKHLRPPLGSR